ncbi:MAG: TolC family protein [Planctomycetaceae bacterium]
MATPRLSSPKSALRGHVFKRMPTQSCGHGTQRVLLAAACGILLCLASTGCSRTFWRLQADKDVYHLLDAKTLDPRWDLPRLDLTPDPRSRFCDPYDPDKPPLPLDDPAANEYMHCVYGMKGYKNWHKLGTAMSIENPCWLEAFGITPESVDAEGNVVGPVPKIEKLTLAQSIELSNIHSREYQTAIEDLYLAALELTFERFQFDVRYLGLGGGEPSADLTHTTVPDGENSLELNQRFGISRLLPTGGQWIVELANNTIWMFQGPNTTSTASVISYSLVQPLLFGAGRKVVLEALTQQERNVLYQARDLVRFRQQFFTDVVGGQGRGFLGLLAQLQNVRNQRNNVEQLEEQLALIRILDQQRPSEISERLERIPEGLQIPADLADRLRIGREGTGEENKNAPNNGAPNNAPPDNAQPNAPNIPPPEIRIYWRGLMNDEEEKRVRALSNDPAYVAAIDQLIAIVRAEIRTLTVAQLETRLADSRIELRNAQRGFQDLLDNFKFLLGLPPDMEVSIDDGMLRQFELIDPRLQTVSKQIKDFVEEWGKIDEENPDVEQTRAVLANLSRLADKLYRDGFRITDIDVNQLQSRLEGQRTARGQIVNRERVAADVERDLRLFTGLKNEFSIVTDGLKRLIELAGNKDLTLKQKKRLREDIDSRQEQLLKISQGLQAIQVGQRVELITLQPFNMSLQAATSAGLENRVDLMNSRAQVMDARRKVEVAANALQAGLDVVVEGDIRTPRGTRPFDFRGDESNFRAGLRFTAPLDQALERNAYRAALVDYQRVRRDYMASEDNVKLDIRQSWRQLDVLRDNLETARQGVRSAALQLDFNVEQASRPVSPEEAQQSRQTDNTGLNILEALDSVLSQQNSLIRIWVQYEQNRLNIHRDMGLMEIDDRGIWNDDVYQQPAELRQPAASRPIGDAGFGPGSGNGDRRERGDQPQPQSLRAGAPGCRIVERP